MRTPPPPRDDLRFSNTTGILQKKKTMWFIGVEVEQEASAPPPKKSWIRPCSNLRNCKLTQKQTQGVSVRASVLCQLSYEDPYIETLTLGALALSSTSVVCNKINLYMSRVLPGLSKQVYGVTSAQFCPITSRYSRNSTP